MPEYLSLFLHIAAGTVTLLAGPVAIYYNFKNPHRHRLAGRVFFYAMLVVCATAVVSFLKRPEQLFFQFLLGIALLVLTTVIRGVRAIRLMRGGSVGRFDLICHAVLGLTGIGMLAMAVQLLSVGERIAFPVLFGVFGLGALADTIANLRFFLPPVRVHPFDWYRLHVGSMLGAFTASTTAFTVNAAPFLPWYLQWFGPALLLLPVQFYFGRLLNEQKKRALEHRMPAPAA